MKAAEPLDIGDPAFKADPFSVYARLRAEAPVVRVITQRFGEAWLVTRYADVSAMLKDRRLVKDAANAPASGSASRRRSPPKLFAPLTRNMLGMDDPDHARLRRLVQASFTPRRVALMATRAEATAQALIHAIRCKPRFDLIADFAMPFPVAVISDLLGVPERDREHFARGSHALIRAGSGRLALLSSLPALSGFLIYIKRLIALKRREPGDDLVSALVQGEAQDRLDENELMAMIAILISAGHETTTNLIGNGVLALLDHPSEQQRLHADPALAEIAVEELLRFCGPVETSTPRYASEPIEIAGAFIPQGALIFGVIASANRDDHHFTAPDKLDLRRAVNRHLTFGEGGHYCIGAPLARLEGKIAFNLLLESLPRLRLAAPRQELRWNPGLVLRGLQRLPLEHRI